MINNLYKLINKLNLNNTILTKILDYILELFELNRNTKIVDIG